MDTSIIIQSMPEVASWMKLLSIVNIGGTPLMICLLLLIAYCLITGKNIEVGKIKIINPLKNPGPSISELSSFYFKNIYVTFIRDEVYIDFENVIRRISSEIFADFYEKQELMYVEEQMKVQELASNLTRLRNRRKAPTMAFSNAIEVVSAKQLKVDFTNQIIENHFPPDLTSTQSKEHIDLFANRLINSLIANLESKCDSVLGIPNDFYNHMEERLGNRLTEIIGSCITRARQKRETLADAYVDRLNLKDNVTKEEVKKKFIESLMHVTAESNYIR